MPFTHQFTTIIQRPGMTLSLAVRLLKTKRGINAADLAQESGVPLAAVLRILLTDRPGITGPQALALAAALGIPEAARPTMTTLWQTQEAAPIPSSTADHLTRLNRIVNEITMAEAE